MSVIYLDNAASTAISSEVLQHLQELQTKIYGNPSSIHRMGREARILIEEARKDIAKLFQVSIGEIFFTSGGTETANLILKNAVDNLAVRRIITSSLEHHCVLHSVQYLKSKGISIEYIPFDAQGVLSLEALESILSQNNTKSLVSVMHINNELGNINPIEEIAAICKKHQALFFSDTVQSVSHLKIKPNLMGIDFISGSAHKFHGPKGIGFAYINGNHKLLPFIHGGSQERNMRAGTENVYAISAMALALKLADQQSETTRQHIQVLKNHFISSLQKLNIIFRINGDVQNTHPKILSISFPKSERSELLVFNLDIAGIAVSGGSACSSGVESISHVLHALNPNDEWTTIRFSFSKFNSLHDIDYCINTLFKLLNR